jgi:hypothetical protein
VDGWPQLIKNQIKSRRFLNGFRVRGYAQPHAPNLATVKVWESLAICNLPPAHALSSEPGGIAAEWPVVGDFRFRAAAWVPNRRGSIRQCEDGIE